MTDPGEGPSVLVIHGWPDGSRGRRNVTARLNELGGQTIVPELRGSGGTRFLSASSPRNGQEVPLAQDALDPVERPGVDRFAVVGHDWRHESRTRWPRSSPNASPIGAVALAYQPREKFSMLDVNQARAVSRPHPKMDRAYTSRPTLVRSLNTGVSRNCGVGGPLPPAIHVDLREARPRQEVRGPLTPSNWGGLMKAIVQGAFRSASTLQLVDDPVGALPSATGLRLRPISAKLSPESSTNLTACCLYSSANRRRVDPITVFSGL